MADATRYTFSYEEIVEALIKKQGIEDGRWAFYVEFGIAGANGGPDDEHSVPMAIVPLLKVGLQKVEADAKMPGTVDAGALKSKKN